MYYKNFFTRYLFRKNLLGRIKMRLGDETRKLTKNEFDDLAFLYQKAGQKPDVIFDCGANIGYVSHQFVRRFPESNVYCFEPNPEVYEKLLINLKAEEARVKKFNMGIGDIAGNIEFFKNNNTGTSSFLKPNDFHMAHMSRKYVMVNVPVVSIDSFCEEKGINHVSILKLDIEGYELKALHGSKRLLTAGAIDFVFAEVNLVPTYNGQPLLEEIIQYLRSFNYIPYNIYGSNETSLRESILTNFLFMSDRMAKEIVKVQGPQAVFTKE